MRIDLEGEMEMVDFIKNFAKIKASNIAKQNKIDYSNVKKATSRESKIELLYREIRKRIFAILLLENLTEQEKNAINDLYELILDIKKDCEKDTQKVIITIDFKDVENIYCLLEIFKEFL